MDRYFIVHGQDGTSIRLEETPWWAHALEQVGGWASEHILPGHLLCCEIPDWAFDMGWGRYDWELGIWEYSLGRMAWQFSSWVEMGFGVWRKSKCKGHAPVTYEWVREHFPELGSPFTDGWNSDDAMESSREDAGDVVL